MACEIISCEGAVFVLWGKPTTKADVERVMDRLKLISESSERPVVYISRIPVDAPPPDADVRQFISDQMPACVKLCSSYHVVLEGSGFIAAMKRAVLSSLFQLSWRNGTFYVHSMPKEVIYKLDRGSRADAEQVLHLAERHGLLQAKAPDEYRASGRPSARPSGRPNVARV